MLVAGGSKVTVPCIEQDPAKLVVSGAGPGCCWRYTACSQCSADTPEYPGRYGLWFAPRRVATREPVGAETTPVASPEVRSSLANTTLTTPCGVSDQYPPRTGSWPGRWRVMAFMANGDSVAGGTEKRNGAPARLGSNAPNWKSRRGA